VAGFLLGKREEEKGGETMKRIILVLTGALIITAMMVFMSPTGFAKQAKEFNPPPGQTEVHKGNSTKSPTDFCTTGKSGNVTECK